MKNRRESCLMKKKLKELAESIEEFGIIQPLILKRKWRKYQIIAGERRYRAN